MNTSSFSNIASKVINELPTLNLPKTLPDLTLPNMTLPSTSNLTLPNTTLPNMTLPSTSNLTLPNMPSLPSMSNLTQNLPNSNALINALMAQTINDNPNIEKIQNLIQSITNIKNYIENSNLPKEIVEKILDDLKAILGMLKNHANTLQLDIETLMSNVIKIFICSGVLLLLLLITLFIVVIIIFKVLSQKYALGATIIFVVIAGFITISTLLKASTALKGTFSNTINSLGQDEVVINKIMNPL